MAVNVTVYEIFLFYDGANSGLGHIHTRGDKHTHARRHVRTHTHTCTHAHTHLHTHTHTHRNTHTQRKTHTHTYTHTHTHTHTPTHTNTHTHTVYLNTNTLAIQSHAASVSPAMWTSDKPLPPNNFLDEIIEEYADFKRFWPIFVSFWPFSTPP